MLRIDPNEIDPNEIVSGRPDQQGPGPGARGILVPLVGTAEEMSSAVVASRYLAEGTCGITGTRVPIRHGPPRLRRAWNRDLSASRGGAQRHPRRMTICPYVPYRGGRQVRGPVAPGRVSL